MFSIPQNDLELIISKVENELLNLKHARILISGASGFIGKWLTSILNEADLLLDLKLNCLFLTGQNKFDNRSFHSETFVWKKFDFSERVEKIDFGFTHAIHASTPSNPTSGSLDLVKSQLIAFNSMRAMLDDAQASKNIPRVVHLSSGAVYAGSHEFKNSSLAETAPIEQYLADSSYTSTKLLLENEINNARDYGFINGCNARLFAFYGPHLKLDAHFAIGNFMKNSIDGSAIQIKGNPNTIRSYMHPIDLVVLLIKILFDQQVELVNVGSKFPFSILEVANLIRSFSKNSDVLFEDMLASPTSYFPSISLAEQRYKYIESVPLEDGLIRWRKWLTEQPGRIS